MKRNKTGWIFGAVFLFGVPSLAFFGGGMRTDGYIGPLPSSYYDGEPCFTDSVHSYTEFGLVEVQVNPRAVLEDGDPNTYLRCSDFANLNRVICHVGFPNGTVASCSDTAGPRNLPDLDDRVYIVIDPGSPGSDNCDIVIEKTYGEANPACRPASTGGASGTGGGSSTGGFSSSGGGTGTGSCNASNAAAVLSTGQSTTIASNACIHLRVDPTWSSVNPVIQAQPGTAAYPVPFTATSCAGSSAGSLVGNWDQQYLIDGPNPASNFGCDVFVQLQGTGAAVQFGYFN